MLVSLKEIIKGPASSYTGSETTRLLVEKEIESRYGKTELKNLDCFHTLRTFNSWAALGFKVRRGEKAIRSFTFVEKKDSTGNVIEKYKRPVSLFYYRQIEPVNPNKNDDKNK